MIGRGAFAPLPGAVRASRLRMYDWPAPDGVCGGSPHLRLACGEAYLVFGGAGRVQTLTPADGYEETPPRPGGLVWFTLGAIHRLISDDGELDIVVLMQNAGLPAAGGRRRGAHLPGERPWDRPVRYLRIRMTKDGHDFVSGAFSSVQDGPHALWHVGLASPGGDRHVHKDGIEAGQTIALRSLRVSFEMHSGLDACVEIDGRPAQPGDSLSLGADVAVYSEGATIVIRPTAAAFGSAAPVGRLRGDSCSASMSTCSMPWSPWRRSCRRSARSSRRGAATVLPPQCVPPAAQVAASEHGDVVELTWKPRSRLTLTARTAVGTREDHAAALNTAVSGRKGSRPAPDGSSRARTVEPSGRRE